MDHVLTGSYGDAEMRALLRLVGWTEADAANLPGIRRAIALDIDRIVSGFYDRLDSFDELATLLADRAQRARLEIVQRAYLLALGEGIGEPGYRASRLRIGAAHERVGLAPRWFMGAASVLTGLIGAAIAAVGGDQAEARRATLAKVMQVDAILAIEAYHRAAMAHQGVLLRELEEARGRLEQTVRTDALTGLRSRQAILADLAAEHGRAARFGRPFALLFVDVDRFKAINDRLGHGVGDEVLRHVARALAGALRPADLIGRYGGEEFVIGLIECEGPEALDVAERLRATVAGRALVCAGARLSPTVSIGLATRAGSAALDDLIARADAAMYQAKRAGRDRVVAALTSIKDAAAPAVVA